VWAKITTVEIDAQLGQMLLNDHSSILIAYHAIGVVTLEI
jgi:hypothetical protein